MNRLISIEFQKLWSNRASRFLIISYFVILSFIALIASVEVDILGMHFNIAEQGIFNFPYIWHFNTFIAALGKIFLAVVIVSMMANEYTYGTLKQNLIDGLSKSEFIQSKFITVLAFALASTLFIFILSLILGYSFSSYDEPSIVFSDLEFIGAFFVKLTAFFSFCLFIGIVIKRSAFALGFLIVWYIFEKIIHLLLAFRVFEPNSLMPDKIMAFLPLESMSNLIREPFTRFEAYRAIEGQLSEGSVVTRDYSVHWYTIIIALAWTAIFMFLSYRILKKRDL